SLLSRLRSLSRQPPQAWGHRERHVAAKAAAYLARFCTKTSPNGVFAATGLAWVGSPGAPGGAPGIDRVDVILNIFEAGKVAASLAADGAIESAFAPRPNPTLREASGTWSYWTPASLRNPTEAETLCRVKDQPVLRAFIEESARGERAPSALVGAVADRCGMDREELSRFYHALVNRGILIAEVEIPFNTRRPLRFLASAVRAAGCAPPWLERIEAVESGVDALPSLSGTDRIASMERIGRELDSLPHARDLARDELYRLDAATSLSPRLPESVFGDLTRAMRVYVRMFAAMYPAEIYRRRFVKKFLDLHPPDVEIPLLDLYHGFAEPEDRGERPAAFPEPAGGPKEGGGANDPLAVMRRLRDHFAQPVTGEDLPREVAFDDAALTRLIGETPEPPWACGVLFQLAAPDWDSVLSGRYRLVLSSLFNGAGLALGRFAHLHGGRAPDDENPIVQELRRAWTCVERPGAIVAEVSYNHHARTANAGLRPAIFRHEIEMPGERTTPGAVAIPLKDLTIRFDGGQKRFVMRWTQEDREVIPVVSSGVDPVGLTSFLVSVGQQGLQQVGFFPGFDLAGVTHWPRIVCGRVVLFRERWVFRSRGWPSLSLGGSSAPDAEQFLETIRWRRRHHMPRHVFAHTSAEPKPRYVDLDSPVFWDLFRRMIAGLEGKPDATLHVAEMNPGPGGFWASDASGDYPSEFLLQMEGPAAQASDV
ncbi:MAG TPA: lantibiotic dehydratase, partial [Candidatus Saccharimonadales bacterium]|nr:lantibiotic dehydratase [Candidatus Saccharimonadales bacterium]